MRCGLLVLVQMLNDADPRTVQQASVAIEEIDKIVRSQFEIKIR